ncbi:MAG: hypothetical protein AB8B49_10910 [Nitratireductor sp.]
MKNNVLKFTQEHALEIPQATLEMGVANTLSKHTEFTIDRIITQSNKDKYYDPDQPLQEHDYLDEVFELMVGLNKQGLSIDSLGVVFNGGPSFKDCLLEACKNIALEFADMPMTYVELGPEPIKTAYILKTLKLLGVQVSHYIAVDINPASEKHMRPVLEETLPDTKFDFVTSSFEEFSLEKFLNATGNNERYSPALVTMLGFQEGNDDPAIMSSWLENVMRSGDMLLSEVQLYNVSSDINISDFYKNPLMQRFSRIAFEQAISNTLPSLNRFFLLPVETVNSGYITAAIMAEEFVSQAGVRSLFVSNYCLKYTKEQYEAQRTYTEAFEVLDALPTEDQSLVFQISKKV